MHGAFKWWVIIIRNNLKIHLTKPSRRINLRPEHCTDDHAIIEIDFELIEISPRDRLKKRAFLQAVKNTLLLKFCVGRQLLFSNLTPIIKVWFGYW